MRKDHVGTDVSIGKELNMCMVEENVEFISSSESYLQRLALEERKRKKIDPKIPFIFNRKSFVLILFHSLSVCLSLGFTNIEKRKSTDIHRCATDDYCTNNKTSLSTPIDCSCFDLFRFLACVRPFPRTLLSAIAFTAGLLVVIFVVTNWNNDGVEIEFPTVKCNCPTPTPRAAENTKPSTPAKIETVAIVTKKETTSTMTTTTPPLPPCNPISNESAIQRAIIIYYPHHQSEYFFPRNKMVSG